MPVLCDNCFYDYGNQSSMEGPIEVTLSAPMMYQHTRAYQCRLCTRCYIPQPGLGYLDYPDGRPQKNRRQLGPCNSDGLEPMYIAEVLPDSQLKLKCPNHSYEKIVDSAPPVSRSVSV